MNPKDSVPTRATGTPPSSVRMPLDEQVEASWHHEVARHVGDILLSAFVLLKGPLSLSLATMACIAIFAAMFGHITDIARVGVRSIGTCDLPVVSLLPICASNTPSKTNTPSTARADLPRLMAIQHRALDELSAARSDAASDLVLNIKHAELAVRDLVVMVQSSDLDSKGVLASTLNTFVSEARETGRGLQSLSSKIHGTLDSIVAFNAYVLRALESAKAASKAGKPGDLKLDEVVLRTFHSSFTWFAAAISEIIVEAVPLAAQLDILEERLATVHAIGVQEDLINNTALDDLLWALWTRLGGNRQQLRDLENRASVLRSVQAYRNVAVAYVASTMHTLTAIDAELCELRDRLNAPAVEGSAIPLEVQLEGIERSAHRLEEGTHGRGVVMVRLSWMREDISALEGKT